MEITRSGLLLDHVTLVSDRICPSLKRHSAANCTIVPFAMLTGPGCTVIDVSTAAPNVTVVAPEIPVAASLAVTLAVPLAACAVTRPLEPAAFETVAPAVAVQVTSSVRSCVRPSEYVPVAVNGSEIPSGITGSSGVTSIETSVAAVTVSRVDPEIAPSVAVIVVEPGTVSREVDATPWICDAFEIEATSVAEEVHTTCAVRSCFELSL